MIEGHWCGPLSRCPLPNWSSPLSYIYDIQFVNSVRSSLCYNALLLVTQHPLFKISLSPRHASQESLSIATTLQYYYSIIETGSSSNNYHMIWTSLLLLRMMSVVILVVLKVMTIIVIEYDDEVENCLNHNNDDGDFSKTIMMTTFALIGWLSLSYMICH